MEEDRKRLLALFDDQARGLRRLTGFFLVPALVFGLLIFVPFTQQVTSRSRLAAELESVHAARMAAEEQRAGIVAAEALADALRLAPRLRRELETRWSIWDALLRMDTFDADLARDWASGAADIDLRRFPDVAARLPVPAIAPAEQSDCIWLDDRRWRTCFPFALGARLCIGRGCLVYPDLRSYVEGLPSEMLDPELAQELIDALAGVAETVREETPPLLQMVDGPDAGWRDFRSALDGWEAFRHRVADRRRDVQADLDALARRTTGLDADLERTDRLIESIERSGSTFETPLGPLPLGIRELVFLYPTILGVAYLLCLAAFLRLVALRRGVAGPGRTPDPAGPAPDPEYVALAMPLWYDPLRPAWRQVGRILLALAPLPFLLWSAVALRAALAAVFPDSDSRFDARWYEVLLLLTLVAVGVMLVRVTIAMASEGLIARPGATAVRSR
jgi:hypothetical protein